MKQNMVLVISFFTASVHGMETNSWAVTLGGTKINLNEGNMLRAYADGKVKVDCIVVGRHEQDWSRDKILLANPVGECRQMTEIVFKEKRSDKDYKVMSCDSTLCLGVMEPGIWHVDGTYHYIPRKLDTKGNEQSEWHENDKAIAESLKDVAVCYNNVLNDGLQRLRETKDKSIALPTLLWVTTYAMYMFPRDKQARSIVNAIIEFIQNNPGAYDRIELFVEEPSKLAAYKQLLEACDTEK